jgi:hypothetical protein
MTFNPPGPSFPHVFSGNPEVAAEFHIEPLKMMYQQENLGQQVEVNR